MFDNSFLEKLYNRDKRIVSRAISIVESDQIKSAELLNRIFHKTGNAYRIGITGPPGSGKSTITNQLTKLITAQDKSVGIIAVDPTSPFTGGALLGDRVRMSEIGTHPNVFIRSMATRGSLGGLSKKAIDGADILDAAGYDYVIFETVGVGQSELDIAQAADTTVVVLVPESGDAVQAMKAGLMEIADLFVLNKSDRPGAESAAAALRTILSFRDHDADSWMIPILKSIASENKGINEIVNEIENHKIHLEQRGLLKKLRERRSKTRIKEIVELVLQRELWTDERIHNLNEAIEDVVLGNISPYNLANKIVDHYKTQFNN
ncbi:MAG: methylmalonyl Co-A mutase-associated GTPase MeaB [Melioribacteraceae bacterium]|nr:methylmalonyl Co-A mutase-associated GTPase MeaB [Melioribacteraceae bacterium]RJP58570.1 MAG: methylmalonyl Co-A mutase-associated GTPase MeaB [Ignavibacteriales bacterium]WKZ68183.1 MAG: methylmalonyl Co-A mutase-associated GTPase MeaB [Melioribacteraceae bacterium]